MFLACVRRSNENFAANLLEWDDGVVPHTILPVILKSFGSWYREN